MKPLRLAHPAGACIEHVQRCRDPFEKAEAVFLAFEMLLRFDALALANCALRDGVPLSDLARSRLLASQFHMGDWKGLLESLVKTAAGAPFKTFRTWLQGTQDGAVSKVQKLVQLRNRKAHDERRIDTAWVTALADEAGALLNEVVALHPPLSELVATADGRLKLKGMDLDVSGPLLRVDHTSDSPRLGLYKGASGGRMFWSFLDGSEQECREGWEAFARVMGTRIPTLETLDARADTGALAARIEAAARKTIRHVTDLRRYRPEQTISRIEPQVFLEAFLKRDIPLLLVEGPGGAGKSTWLCQMTEGRLAQGLPVLFETSPRLAGGLPHALAGSLLVRGDLSDGLERLALDSADGRVVVIIDDVATMGGDDPVFVSCLRWAEALANGSGVRLIVAIRSEHLQAFRAAGGTLATTQAQTYLLPPLVEPELIRLAERLPVAVETTRSSVLAQRRELARYLAWTATATLRRPAFATAILESGGAGQACLSWSPHALYSRLIDTDILGKDESDRPLWPGRGRVISAIARTMLSQKRLFVSLDAIEAAGVRLLDPKNGQRLTDYAALLDSGHLAEHFDDFEVSIGFSNPRLFECVAARLSKTGSIPENIARLAWEAAAFPSAMGVAAFLIAESWGAVNIAEVVGALAGFDGPVRTELLLQVGTVAPGPFLGLLENVGRVDLASCLDAVTTQIHIGEVGLAAAAAALLRREPARSPEEQRARYVHVRALYENDDFSIIAQEVGAMTEPVDMQVKMLAAEALASCADWIPAEKHWRSILESLPPEDRAVRGAALRGLGSVLFHQGHSAEAERLVKEALPFLDGDGCGGACSEALGELAEIMSASGRFEEARECLDRSYRITAPTGYLTALGIIEGLYGRVAADEKAWDMAEARLRAAMSIHERVGNRWRCAWTLDHLARVEEATGRIEQSAASRAAAALLYAGLGIGNADGAVVTEDSGADARLQRLMAELRG